MKSENSTLNENEPGFRRLLQDTQANRVPVDVLFENEIFKNRLRLITMAHARTEQDAEDLANDVLVKVWQNLRNFKPNDRDPYGGFFAWLRAVTRNTYLNNLRRTKVEFHQTIEHQNIADTQIDIEASVLYKEVMAEFEKVINALPERERLAIAYYLQGFSFREISEKMLRAGFSVSHVTVLKWIRDALVAFFHKSGHVENITSKNVRVTKVRATRAKREFHTILEQAINSGTQAITPENVYRTRLASVKKRKTAKPTQPALRPGWQSGNDLLKSMQSPESKQGIQAAFEASPEALGRAAIEHANKGRKVPVGSLATFLMATSTANVLGRVMKLSRDVA